MSFDAKAKAKANNSNKKKDRCGEETNPNPILVETNTSSATISVKSSRAPKKSRKICKIPVQTLFETCKEVFGDCVNGIIPPPDNINKIQAILDDFKPLDVGLSPKMRYFRSTIGQGNPVITYLELHTCKQFSIGIFCLPPSGVLPLHNHPGMTVFSKLLFGTLHIKSYDWAADSPRALDPTDLTKGQHPESRLAKLKVDADFTAPCTTSILYPTDGGNLHCFTAVTECAVLDVLGPPYSDPDGRHCSYYSEHPYSHLQVNGDSMVSEEEAKGCAWLQEKEKPEELTVVRDMYRGPNIMGK